VVRVAAFGAGGRTPRLSRVSLAFRGHVRVILGANAADIVGCADEARTVRHLKSHQAVCSSNAWPIAARDADLGFPQVLGQRAAVLDRRPRNLVRRVADHKSHALVRGPRPDHAVLKSAAAAAHTNAMVLSRRTFLYSLAPHCGRRRELQ